MARFPSMTINPAGEAREKSWWVYTLLGVVLLFAGAFVLADLVFASAVSAIWIASAIIVAGVYQVLQALRGRGQRGFALDTLVGILYVAGGAILHCWSRHPLPMACLRTLGLGSLPWRRPHLPRDCLDRILALGSRRSARFA